MRAIDKYDVLLFDVGLTFMFDVDRFEATEDFHATYRVLGGRKLDRDTVQRTILNCLGYLLERYDSPDYYDRFPRLGEALKAVTPELGADDIAVLEKAFALHECGHVPQEYAQCLKRLSTTHRLGLISNIWAGKASWLEEFKRKDILDLFEVMVFSSDFESIKPSPTLFKTALERLDITPSKILFTGDSHRCDICGAQGVGMDTTLVLNEASRPFLLSPRPDHTISSLLDLPSLK